MVSGVSFDGLSMTRLPAATAVTTGISDSTAIELFAEKGYDNPTLDEVATATDISRRTLFNYFRSKDDLALSSPAEQGELIAERLAQRPADEDPWTALREAFGVLEEIDMTAEGGWSSSPCCSATTPRAPGTPRNKPAGRTCSHR